MIIGYVTVLFGIEFMRFLKLVMLEMHSDHSCVGFSRVLFDHNFLSIF